MSKPTHCTSPNLPRDQINLSVNNALFRVKKYVEWSELFKKDVTIARRGAALFDPIFSHGFVPDASLTSGQATQK